MGRENRRSRSTSPVNRRTYLKSGTLALGALVSPAIVSKASAQERELPNSISVVSDTDERAFYRFTVSDRIEARWEADLTEADYPDGVDGRTASGAVAERGADNFHFAGDVVTFALDGPATVYMNGDEIDVKERWESKLPNRLLVESEDAERATYEFDVSGDS